MTVDPRILELCAKVTAKRPRTVIEHLLKHGSVTTEEIQALGYDHPPRAIRDVRETGIPLETYKVKSDRTGRTIGAYRFADPAEIKAGRIGGRRAFPKAFKDALLARYGSADTITGERMDGRYLQIDHRVPYEVAGDGAAADLDVEEYMLLDASNQRIKSWSCEHCPNWQELHDPAICGTCYWASPENYSHVAMRPERRADVVWSGDETAAFDRLNSVAESKGMSVVALIKEAVDRLKSE